MKRIYIAVFDCETKTAVKSPSVWKSPQARTKILLNPLLFPLSPALSLPLPPLFFYTFPSLEFHSLRCMSFQGKSRSRMCLDKSEANANHSFYLFSPFCISHTTLIFVPNPSFRLIFRISILLCNKVTHSVHIENLLYKI